MALLVNQCSILVLLWNIFTLEILYYFTIHVLDLEVEFMYLILGIMQKNRIMIIMLTAIFIFLNTELGNLKKKCILSLSAAFSHPWILKLHYEQMLCLPKSIFSSSSSSSYFCHLELIFNMAVSCR